MPPCHRYRWRRAVAVLLPLALLLPGCGNGDEPGELEEVPSRNGPDVTESVEQEGSEGIRLIRAPAAGPEYPNVRLGFLAPEPGARFAEGEAVELHFSLSGFELDVPTPDAGNRGLARGPGQYLHLVVNDGASEAVGDISAPVVLEDLPAGTHVIQAFPGRDWHEGVKTPGALAQRVVVVGDAERELPAPEEWGPNLIYSRPQGEYRGTEADSVLVDFYLSGVRLSQDGYRVRLRLNGTREFLIHEWIPHLLLGLPSGEHSLRLELVDADGVRVRTPFTPVERTITVWRNG